MNVRPKLAAAPLALALALAACGAPATDDGVASASSGTAKPTASASAPVDRREAQLKFAQCMREHGVSMQDPDPNGRVEIKAGKGEEAKVNTAQQACAHFLQAAIGDSARKPDQKTLDQGLKFAQCMREHGIDMKDPGPDGRIDIRIQEGTSEQKVNDAQEACKEFQPGGSPS
jgi:hypothetical protein